MNRGLKILTCAVIFTIIPGEGTRTKAQEAIPWPPEIVRFAPDERNPIFGAGPPDAWDSQIVERAWILKDDDVYKMYYTGYRAGQDTKLARVRRMLGYATSPDGVAWKRHPRNPIQDDVWIRDPCVLKHEDVYYLFAEMEKDSHWFTSRNGIVWDREGGIVIRDPVGRRLPPSGGTNPTVFIDADGKWYLYFQSIGGIWGAMSDGPDNWVLIVDRPLLKPSPGQSDGVIIAPDQVLRYKGRWYMFYEGRGNPDDPRRPWSVHVATSEDGVEWVKYPQNPIIHGGRSAFLVDDGDVMRLYTTHGSVRLFWPNGSEPVPVSPPGSEDP